VRPAAVLLVNLARRARAPIDRAQPGKAQMCLSPQAGSQKPCPPRAGFSSGSFGLSSLAGSTISILGCSCTHRVGTALLLRTQTPDDLFTASRLVFSDSCPRALVLPRRLVQRSLRFLICTMHLLLL
jgi:hypothetical protein